MEKRKNERKEKGELEKKKRKKQMANIFQKWQTSREFPIKSIV